LSSAATAAQGGEFAKFIVRSRIQAIWKHDKMCVKKTEAIGNLHYEPECDKYLREETESNVNNIG